MNKNFTQFIEPANSEHRWWIVGLTLILWAIFYMVLSSFFILIMSNLLSLDNLKYGLFTTPIEVYVLLSTFLIWLVVFLILVKLFHKRGLNSLIGKSKLIFFKNFIYAIIISGIFIISSQNLIPNNEKIIENALEFAQRVVIGTLAFNDEATLGRLLATYGNEKLVISVDHNDGLIVVNGWQQTTKISLIDAVNDFRKMGFSEYLSTSIVRDGTLKGPDLEPLKMVNQIKNVNLIVSGGISNIDDVIKVKELDPFGVILGKALYENQVTIEEAKGI